MYTYEELRDAGRKPRVHGNGFVQLDLNDSGTKRLHVWDEDIPRQTVATPIHDHVFSLRSTVLVGTLIHEELEESPRDAGTHQTYVARQEPGTQNTILVPEPWQCDLEVVQRLILAAGSVYTFPAWKLHQTDHRDTTMTIMSKINAPESYGRPRVLVPVGSEPDNEFHRDGFDEEYLWEFIEKALVLV
jgi:hypothetical protein